MRMSTEHPGEYSTGDREIRCAKKYPGDADRAVSGKTGENPRNRMPGPRFVFEQTSADALDYQIRAVQQTPDNKCPRGAMPQAAEKHDNHKICGSTKWSDLIAPERNVKVIAQKRGKRNVPAPPEIGETNRGVRKTKIVLEMKPKG